MPEWITAAATALTALLAVGIFLLTEKRRRSAAKRADVRGWFEHERRQKELSSGGTYEAVDHYLLIQNHGVAIAEGVTYEIRTAAGEQYSVEPPAGPKRLDRGQPWRIRLILFADEASNPRQVDIRWRDDLGDHQKTIDFTD